MHQAALATPPPPPQRVHNYSRRKEELLDSESRRGSMHGGSLAVRSGQILSDARVELERRVKALEEAASVEMSASDPPSYTEEELMFFYEDVLALPQEPVKKVELSSKEVAQREAERDMAVVNAAERRLFSSDADDVSPQNASEGALTSDASSSNSVNTSPHVHRRVLSQAHHMISRVEAARAALKLSPDLEPSLPVTVLSLAEFQSLMRISIRAKDAEAAELTLNLMKRSNLDILEHMTTGVMEVHSWAGNVAGVERVIARYLTDAPAQQQRHFHIKAHLVATPSETIPASALEVLHSYESQSLPAPMHTYTSVITALLSSKSSLGRAQAWDLFSHMRYVAHPDPDVPLYTAMIRACASPLNARSSEPEKALDLWTEMTVDRRLSPTAGAYDAIILACARSGSTMYVNEAFRLAKQMLDAHRNARGESAFAPSRRTFCALLEGAKRVGDLARARWILAQMIAEQRSKDGERAVENVNEEVMMHVFHAYASYRPPFKRGDVRSVKDLPAASKHHDSGASAEQVPAQAASVEAHDQTPAFTQVPPQSSTEVIHEVQVLFDRILNDTGLRPLADPTHDDLPLQEKFKDVELTPRLLNSYLSVYYRHGTLETARDLYRQVFDEYKVSRTGRTYVEALERCAIARRGHERTVALEFGEEVWAQWQTLEIAGQEGGRPLSGRTIEKAHIAMIRLLALTGHTDRAVQHLRAFAARYPPSDIRTPTPKPALRSTRTTLAGERPLVRMTSAAEVPDDHVPPLIMFDDVEILHHRLVAQGAAEQIAYLKYVCKAYEGYLRARRNAALKMKPGPQDTMDAAPRLSSPSA
ncbi:hypothetical protein LshimejAT787_1601210 [Lyophyllum shimeji]|uniref:Pentatricopeptide repeat-containing protein n=1 Tax=Lyophyllum shimeji TaxID=47721 RepID=A0A9P3PZY0_LYOSH|nr:hypothetical protein LshimejAT787_1601210 [Lyophyllum shimeji]